MIILDTDHVVEFLKGTSPAARRLIDRVDASTEVFATTIVTVEEILRGWLGEIRRVPDTRLQITGYRKLREAVATLAVWRLLEWNIATAQRFEDLRKQKIRIGSADLKIGSIALENSATLLTRNARDFSQIPGLRIEDWLS